MQWNGATRQRSDFVYPAQFSSQSGATSLPIIIGYRGYSEKNLSVSVLLNDPPACEIYEMPAMFVECRTQRNPALLSLPPIPRPLRPLVGRQAMHLKQQGSYKFVRQRGSFAEFHFWAPVAALAARGAGKMADICVTAQRRVSPSRVGIAE